MTDAIRQDEALAMPAQWTWGLMALVYVMQLMNAQTAIEPSVGALLAGGGNLGHLTLTTEPWRLISSMFMHADWFHLLMNLAFLASVGPRVEAVFGWKRYMIIFLAGGVIAGLGSAVWGVGTAAHTNLLGQVQYQLMVSVGASGALMALCGALFAAAMADHDGNSPHLQQEGFIKPLLPAVGFTLAYGFIRQGTDQAAHLVGLAAGCLLGAGLFVTRFSERRVVQRSGLALALLLAPVLSGMLVPLKAAQELKDISDAVVQREEAQPAEGAAEAGDKDEQLVLPEHAGARGVNELLGQVKPQN